MNYRHIATQIWCIMYFTSYSEGSMGVTCLALVFVSCTMVLLSWGVGLEILHRINLSQKIGTVTTY